MRVSRPRVGITEASREVGTRWGDGRPHAKGPIDMVPRALLAGKGRELIERINRPTVNIAGLTDQDRLRIQGRQRVRAHAPLVIHRHPHHAFAPQPQQGQRFKHTDMYFIANDHG